QRLNMVNQAVQMYQYGMQEYVSQFAIQLQQPELVGQIVLDNLKTEMVIMAEAEKLGIALSDEEIEVEIQKLFGYFAEGTPTPAPTQEIIPTSTLTELQLTLIPDTATPTATLEAGEEPPTPTATQEEIEEVEDNSEPDPTATPILKPTEFTYELYKERYQDTLTNLETEIQMDEETFHGLVVAYIYREKVMEAVITDLVETQNFVWARHILLDDETTAQEVLNMLNEGGDFVELAKEHSTGPSAADGGDLSWFAEGTMVEPFAKAAFSLEIGEISEPVETSFGWHIIQVLGKEERPMDQTTLSQNRQTAFNDWLTEKLLEYESEFVISETWTEGLPTEPSLPPELLQLLNQPQQ
ncbi:MAG: peptidylprolyl isomerase, partial [Chloroflexota bacterium]|nr:peptidylprolyl isomerase [Chloroflexota bacterium]